MSHSSIPITPASIKESPSKQIQVHFRIPYFTAWGQSLVLCGQGPVLGGWEASRGHPMRCHHEGTDQLVWEALVNLPWQPSYSYKYAIVREADGSKGGPNAKPVVEKWDTHDRTLVLPEGLVAGDVVEVLDSSWLLDPAHPSTLMTSSAFTKVIKCTHAHTKSPTRPISRQAPVLGESIVRFKVSDYSIQPGEVVCVSGSAPGLGAWRAAEAFDLTPVPTSHGFAYEGEVRLPYLQFPFTYKFGIKRVLPQAQAPILATTATATATNAESASLQPLLPAPALSILSQPVALLRGLRDGPASGSIAAAASPPSSLSSSTVSIVSKAHAGGVRGAGAVAGGAGVGGGGGAAVIDLEEGETRTLTLPLAGSIQMGAPALIVCDCGYLRRDRLWRGAGMALPIFSIRTRSSVGVGEFLDLIPMVDLVEKCGMNLLQILPINDTSVYGTWWDSYPYSSISIYALHPLYLNLMALREEMPVEIKVEVDTAQSSLQSPSVLYEETMKVKGKISKMVFDRFSHEILDSQGFKDWFASNQDWLRPYAIFKTLKDLFNTAEHWQWGTLSHPTSEDILRLASPSSAHYRSIQLTYWTQYHLHLQLSKACRYAESKKVVLKGDIPIGVDKRSVDTWLEPHLFRMDKSTGAPPDYFDPNGQNWGFPTYDWGAMRDKDGGYPWWTRRLKHMSQYFSAYRIDHILGFFRIWEIPGDCTTGKLGYFRPAAPISRQELDSRGIWDIERLTQPYIRAHLLTEVFGKDLALDVAARYLEETGPGCYKLRAQYSSEKRIQAISCRPDSPSWLIQEVEKSKAGLMELRQNVVLLRDPVDPTDSFHPRFNLMHTSSFKELPSAWKESLQWLHDDYLFGRQDELWRSSALSKLPPIIKATDMLVCGEDLGFVPSCVPPVMQELGLLGLRIQRMSTEPGKEFDNPCNYPYLTVASPSCHDVTPLRAWYESDEELRGRFFYEALKAPGPSLPPPQCTPEIIKAIIKQHLLSPSAWAIFPIQDLMALSPVYSRRKATEEIINDPTVSKHYWRYRVHINVEEMVADGAFTQLVKGMLNDSGRA